MAMGRLLGMSLWGFVLVEIFCTEAGGEREFRFLFWLLWEKLCMWWAGLLGPLFLVFFVCTALVFSASFGKWPGLVSLFFSSLRLATSPGGGGQICSLLPAEFG